MTQHCAIKTAGTGGAPRSALIAHASHSCMWSICARWRRQMYRPCLQAAGATPPPTIAEMALCGGMHKKSTRKRSRQKEGDCLVLARRKAAAKARKSAAKALKAAANAKEKRTHTHAKLNVEYVHIPLWCANMCNAPQSHIGALSAPPLRCRPPHACIPWAPSPPPPPLERTAGTKKRWGPHNAGTAPCGAPPPAASLQHPQHQPHPQHWPHLRHWPHRPRSLWRAG